VVRTFPQFTKPQVPHIYKWRLNLLDSQRWLEVFRPQLHRYALCRSVIDCAWSFSRASANLPQKSWVSNQVRESVLEIGAEERRIPSRMFRLVWPKRNNDLDYRWSSIELLSNWKRWYWYQAWKTLEKAFSRVYSLEPRFRILIPSRDYLFPLPKFRIDINPNLAPNNSGILIL